MTPTPLPVLVALLTLLLSASKELSLSRFSVSR